VTSCYVNVEFTHPLLVNSHITSEHSEPPYKMMPQALTPHSHILVNDVYRVKVQTHCRIFAFVQNCYYAHSSKYIICENCKSCRIEVKTFLYDNSFFVTIYFNYVLCPIEAILYIRR